MLQNLSVSRTNFISLLNICTLVYNQLLFQNKVVKIYVCGGKSVCCYNIIIISSFFGVILPTRILRFRESNTLAGTAQLDMGRAVGTRSEAPPDILGHS